MPYIPEDSRVIVDSSSPMTEGELNYAITMLCVRYLGSSYNYHTLNGVIGVLECAKLELYRRMAAPYEDAKMKENGDVYF